MSDESRRINTPPVKRTLLDIITSIPPEAFQAERETHTQEYSAAFWEGYNRGETDKNRGRAKRKFNEDYIETSSAEGYCDGYGCGYDKIPKDKLIGQQLSPVLVLQGPKE